MTRVGVHHPDHDLAVRAHVGGGDVDLWADVVAECVGEPACEASQFALD